MKFRLVLLFAVAAAAALASQAYSPARAQDGSLRAQIVRIDDAGYPNARAVVNVDDTASAAPQLTRDNFFATIDGKPASIVDANLASSQNIPLDVLFVMDTSGSMAGDPIALAKAAAAGFVAQLAPADRVAVMHFDDRVELIQDYTNDRNSAASAIGSLEAHGNTALYEATLAAALKAGSSTANRRAVILLSDGADYGVTSGVTRGAAIDAAASAGVPFFTVAEGTDIDSAYLGAVAQKSGGRFLSAPTPQDLRGLYDGIARMLQSQYVLTFDRSGAAAAEVRVLITVRAGERSAEATASYAPAPVAAPIINIEGVAVGETISERRDIVADVQSAQPVTRVVFRLDGAMVVEAATQPYTFPYDPARFGSGEHHLSVDVDVNGATTEAQISFSSTPPASAPGGGLPVMPIGAGAVVALLASASAVVLVRRKRGTAPAQTAASLSWHTAAARTSEEATAGETEDDAAPAETIGEALGLLISRAGPDVGVEYAVGGRPVSIGSAARCGVRVDDPELNAEEARIWVRSERLMVHRMTRLTSVAADGTVGGWKILDPGDTFDIGAHRFEFQLLPEPEPKGSEDVQAHDPLAEQRRRGPTAPAAGGLATGSSEGSPSRLAHLMPRDSIAPSSPTSAAAEPEERAS